MVSGLWFERVYYFKWSHNFHSICVCVFSEIDAFLSYLVLGTCDLFSMEMTSIPM